MKKKVLQILYVFINPDLIRCTKNKVVHAKTTGAKRANV